MTEKKRQPPPTAFKPGQSGNPAGRPKGLPNKVNRAVIALMGENAEQVAQRVVDAALEGDLVAARLILERTSPVPKDRAIQLPDMPATDSAAGVSEAQEVVFQALAAGEITPNEASTLSSVLEARRRALETVELEQRITALETKR